MARSIVRIVSACALAACSAHAADFTLLNGKTDWTDPNSYKDNANSAVPGSSDRIFTEDNATNELRPSGEKYAASLDLDGCLQLGEYVRLGIFQFGVIHIHLRIQLLSLQLDVGKS